MKKVVLLAPTPPPAGGIAGWTMRMLKAGLSNNWTIRIVDEKSIGKREVFGKKGKRRIVVEIWRCLKIWNSLRNALNDSEAIVVHSCIPAYTLSMLREYVCACITKHKRRKFIIHFRCTIPNTVEGKIAQIVLKRICDKSDLIITLNKKSSEYLMNVTNTPVRLIPNFISEEELVKNRTINKDLKRAVYVGGLVESKGISDILKIASQLPDIQFVLIGKGNEEFENKASRMNLKNVLFTGELDRESVKRELLKADVFLFMTHFPGEGFSNALCEAMASGLPCVATDWAANKDMLGVDGGVIVNVGDVNAAVAAIGKLRTREVRENMCRENIKKVCDEYIEKVVVGKYVNIYEMLSV